MRGRLTAVWMDEHEAKIFRIEPEGFDEATLSAPYHHIHRHPKDQLARTHNHPDDRHRYFLEVAKTLAEADHILLTGPSVAKRQFLRHLQEHDPAVEAKIVGVENVDHPSDAQFVAHARAYFVGDTR